MENGKGYKEIYFFENVYGPHAPVEKKKLWEELLQIKIEKPGTWIMFGDFNIIRRPEERYNSQFCSSFAFYFYGFIVEGGLHDIRMDGHRFTFFCQTEIKLSKLDRFLVCSNFINSLPSVLVTAHPRELSDHCLVILQTSAPDFGKTSFRFYNSWMSREGFDNSIFYACKN